MNSAATYAFRDSTGIRKWTIGFLVLYLFATAFALWAGVLEFRFLDDLENGIFQSDARLEQVAAAVDDRQLIAAVFQTGFRVILAFLVLRWVYIACANAHARTDIKMKFTPGWAVGWYFVPLFNLVRPFQAMLEVWHVSQNPAVAPPQKTPALVGAWWFFWINSLIVDRIASRTIIRAETIDDFQLSNAAYLATDLLLIPLTVALIFLINKIHEFQMQQAAQPMPEPPTVPKH
jgi:hypothetical protein